MEFSGTVNQTAVVTACIQRYLRLKRGRLVP